MREIEKPGFALAKLRFTLEAQDSFELPIFKGSTFRGAFGRVLKKIICIRRDRDCANCLIKETCAYAFIFETELFFGCGHNVSLPRPFVLQMSLEDKSLFSSGEPLELKLLLIGRGIDYMPYFIFAFEELGHLGIGKDRGKFKLVSIHDAYTGSQIYACEDKVVKSEIKRLTMEDLKEIAKETFQNEGRITFVTPFRTKYNGHLMESFTFEGLTRAILRRYMYLADWFFRDDENFDTTNFIEDARKVQVIKDITYWHDWQRYSSRQDGKMKLGGIVGEIIYTNLIQDLWFLLVLGQELHIGKNTTFGLGHYVLSHK